MIDIPLGKALVPVERGDYGCEGCVFFSMESDICGHLDPYCSSGRRQDGKDVIFKSVDYPAKKTKGGTE